MTASNPAGEGIFELLVAPTSMVVVGVSSSKRNLGKEIIKNCLSFGYKGDLFAVGPKGGEVFGVKIHRSLAELPACPKFAAILVPAANVPSLIEECGSLGIRGVLISSGGFSEYEGAREDLESVLLAKAREHRVRFIGPNCIGVVNMETGLCTPFAPLHALQPLKGNVSVIAQSGGVGIRCMDLLSEEYVGFSKMISIGNKLDLDEADFVEALLTDADTHVICAYLEGISSGRRFLEVCAASRKPIIVMKANRSAVSSRIAQSHTAALASDDRVLEAALRQAGVVRVDDLREFVPSAKAFALPPLRGKRLAVLSMSGGISVIGADACEEFGFELPELPQSLTRALEERGRGGVIHLANPLDFGDIYDPSVFIFAIEEILKLSYIDGAVVSLPRLEGLSAVQGEQSSFSGEAGVYLKELMDRTGKPIAVSFFSGRRAIEPILAARQIPIFMDIRESLWALSLQRRYWETKLAAEKMVSSIVAAHAGDGVARAVPRQLAPDQALELVAGAGVNVARSVVASSLDEIEEAVRDFGFPLVMKVAAEEIVHKSDIGGVRLGLTSGDEVRRSFAELGKLCRDNGARPRVIVQAMTEPGVEVIVGARRDDTFGPVVLFGLGGIWVEVLDDVSIRMAPIDKLQARAMVAEVRGASILRGFRGGIAANIDPLCEAIAAVSRFIAVRPEVSDLEINPLIVSGGLATAVDARATCRAFSR